MARRSTCVLTALALAATLATATGQDPPPTPTEAPPPPPAPSNAEERGAGTVKGTVTLDQEGIKLEALGPVVAYLDGVDGQRIPFTVPAEVPRISQRQARFSPDFLVVAVGQSVSWPNDDRIVHNVFSYSEGNEFDLGLYPKGETKLVVLKSTGLVQVYCSIHSSMNATIFVAPSPYHDRVAAGAFAIKNVPPGRYTLKSWNRRVPETTQVVEVKAGAETTAEVKLGPR